MPFIANSDSDRKAMLARVGVGSLDELFADIPAAHRFPKLDLPEPLSEMEVVREVESMAALNLRASSSAWFLGAGCYWRFTPAVVGAIASRGEFLTAYTPYQPEVSQGTLQAIFEYQSMAARLMGMEVVNASHYDGATALAEAVLLSGNHTGRREVVLPAALHPEYRQVIESYCAAFGYSFVEFDGDPKTAKPGDSTACVVVQLPDFEGRIWDLTGLADAAHAAGALLVVHVDPVYAALFKCPGELGADLATAEGQSLGNAMNFGGPFLGMMGATNKLVRKMPGRIVGEAKDAEGRRGFVLTLSAREQHIRREKAVSNICSNQGLSMLQACVHMAAMGKAGLRAVAELSWHKAHYAASLVAKAPGFSLMPGEFFCEFVVRTPRPAAEIVERLESRGVVPGLALSRYYPERTHELLVCVTEMCTKAQIELLASSLEEAVR